MLSSIGTTHTPLHRIGTNTAQFKGGYSHTTSKKKEPMLLKI